MKDYNGFSGPHRDAVNRFINDLLRLGVVERPTTCVLCGQGEGIVDMHHEDYNKPMDFVGLCYRCHLLLHCRDKSPRVWGEYISKLRQGWRYPACYSRDFNAIRQHLNGSPPAPERCEPLEWPEAVSKLALGG